MINFYYFIAGMFVGTFIGILVASLMTIGKQADEKLDDLLT